ncbi:MAG: type II toxin-antitoxin system HicB family antitoxin [Dehalococcoidia bacterium]|nr:type II toxin-antitoxin system HicB family antitoxin [Dehalococcoidia bacterium]
MTEYVVLFERGERSWGASVPDLPGCYAVAKTRDEVERRIREAIEMHIELLAQDGEAIPAPVTEAARIAV